MPESKDITVTITAKNRKRRDWRSTRLWTPVLLGVTLAFMEAGSLTSLWRLHQVGWFDIAIAVMLVILWPLIMEAHARDAARLAHYEGWHMGYLEAQTQHADQKDEP